MKMEIQSITFRFGDWEHCFCCKPRKVKGKFEANVSGSWIPLCTKHLEQYILNYVPAKGCEKAWRKKEK